MSKPVLTGSVFVNNRTQSVRLPLETRFPNNAKRIAVRVLGQDQIISPVDRSWDSFFTEKTTLVASC